MRERLTASLRSSPVEEDEDLQAQLAASARPVPGKVRARESARWAGIARRAEPGFEQAPELDDLVAAQETAADLRAGGTPLPDSLRKKFELSDEAMVNAARVRARRIACRIE